uniref:mRNA 5'-phosphatase n=1 Tax=viral metagenome TaxID=1070528 RepID=A0A6C0KAJ4_9ZZZZ
MESDPDLVPGIECLMEIIQMVPEKVSEECEVELRLGYIETDDELNINKFDSNAGEAYFGKVLETLHSFKKWNRVVENQRSTDYYANALRLTVEEDGSRTCIMKNRIRNIDFTYDSTPFDIRISLSQEMPRNVSDFPTEERMITKTRHKTRTSFYFDFWSFDLTEVKTCCKELESVSYEIEIELHDVHKALREISGDRTVMWVAHGTLLKLRQLVFMCEDPSEEPSMIIMQDKMVNKIVTTKRNLSFDETEEPL